MFMETTERSSDTLKYLTNRGTSSYAGAASFLNDLDVNVRFATIKRHEYSRNGEAKVFYVTEVWI